jgi:hypothetical protein
VSPPTPESNIAIGSEEPRAWLVTGSVRA